MLSRLAASGVVALTVALAAPVGIGNAHTVAPRASAGAIKTAVVHVTPVGRNGKLKPGYTVKKSFPAASCEGGSEATNNAYRCFAGKSKHALNAVLDPCWVEGTKKFAVCLLSPASFSVYEITVTQGYDNAGYTKKVSTVPWGVELANGVQCDLLPSMAPDFHGKRVNYSCPGKTFLYGTVNSSKKTWTIRQATAHGTGFKNAGTAQLAKAWFGKASIKG